MLDVKRSALLGYAIMSFADSNDLGRGLQLELRKFNPRVASQAQINALILAVGGDPADLKKEPTCLNRFSPDHAMYLMVKRQYIDLDSLCKDPFSSTFNQVRWKSEARHPDVKDVAYLVNGNTRRHLCLSLGTHAIDALKSVKGEGKERAEAIKQVRIQTSWIVAFYDQDVIEESPFHTNILYELSKNQPTYQVPDSEAASLQLTINFILTVPPDLRLEKIRKAGLSRSYMLQGMQKRLQHVFKDTTLFLAIVKLNHHSVLWHPRVLTVNLAYSWRGGCAPFMEAIILQGVTTLDFVTSGQTFPAEVSQSEVRSRLNKRPPQPVADTLDSAFFDMLDAVYKKHLYPFREFFSLCKSSRRDQKKWADAMDAYWPEVQAGIQNWADGRRSEVKSLRKLNPETIEKALGLMLENLEWVTNGLFNSTLFGMRFKTPPPLLCPAFLLDVSESMVSLKPWLELAWRWLDPYLMSSQATQHSFGTSLSIMDALLRFSPDLDVRELLWEIASEIFSMRTDCLVALQNADAKLKTSPQPPSFSSLPMLNDVDKPKAVYEIVLVAIKSWRSASSAEVIATRAPRQRDLADHERDNLLQFFRGVVLINALASTYYPWASCPPNQVSGRLSSAAQKAVQCLWLSYHQAVAYADISAFWVLRAEIKHLLHMNTHSFKGWWDCNEYEGDEPPVMPPSSAGQISTRGQLSSESKSNAIRAGTEKAIQTIVKILCTEEGGAIPTPVGDDKSEFRPFEEVYDAAMALFEAVAVASFRTQSVYTEPGMERLQIVSKKKRAKCLAAFEIPSNFKPAPFSVIQTYYASFDAEGLSNLEAFGPGYMAFQKGKKLVAAEPEKKAKKAVEISADDAALDDDDLTFKVGMMDVEEEE